MFGRFHSSGLFALRTSRVAFNHDKVMKGYTMREMTRGQTGRMTVRLWRRLARSLAQTRDCSVNHFEYTAEPSSRKHGLAQAAYGGICAAEALNGQYQLAGGGVVQSGGDVEGEAAFIFYYSIISGRNGGFVQCHICRPTCLREA